MEEDSNGKVEETRKEETHRNGVGDVKKLFEEFKSKVHHQEEAVLHGKDSSSSSSESDEEEEKIESVEEEVPDTVSYPVEVVSPETTQEVEIEIPVEDDDSGYTNLVEQETEEPEKVIELESEDVVEEEKILPSSEEANGVSEGIEETEALASYENVGETSEVVDEEASKEEEEKNSEPPVDVPVLDSGNKAEIITDTTRTPPIISISNRTVQPTSWRSCCGLFDVLRRNK